MAVKVLARFQIRHLYPVLPVALAVVLAANPIGDNSFLWHVRAGSMQATSNRVLTTDPFSYVTQGEVWRTQSWLVELLYAFAESTFGGVGWASMMVGMIIAGALILTALVTYRSARSTISTGAWLLVMAWLLVPFSQPRPVVFSYLFLAVVVAILALGDRVLWLAVPIVWMWAGIHGSWVVGLGLFFLVALSRRSPRIAAVGAIAAATTVATAHGLGAWSVTLLFARSSSVLSYIDEWQVPDFVNIALGPFLIILVGILVAAIKGRIVMSDLWVVVPFLVLGFMSRRMVPVAALVLLPFAARSMQLSVPAAARKFQAFPWFALAILVASAVIAHARPRDGFDMEVFPSEAAIAAVDSERFFHDDAVGGYLIYRGGPEQKVYIDDRVELYGEARFTEFLAAREGDYTALFDRLGMTSALVRPDWPLHDQLLRDGWHVVYKDSVFEVLETNDH